MTRLCRETALLGIFAVLTASAPAFDDAPVAESGPAVAKADAARKAYEQARVFFLERRIGMDTAYLWSIRALDTKLVLCHNDVQRQEAYQTHLDDMKAIERILRAAGRVGQTNKLEYASIDYYKIEAEDWVAHGRVR